MLPGEIQAGAPDRNIFSTGQHRSLLQARVCLRPPYVITAASLTLNSHLKEAHPTHVLLRGGTSHLPALGTPDKHFSAAHGARQQAARNCSTKQSTKGPLLFAGELHREGMATRGPTAGDSSSRPCTGSHVTSKAPP